MHRAPRTWLSLGIVFAFVFVGSEVAAANSVPSSVVLASTPEAVPSVRPDGQLTDPERPGFRVALLREAGKRCGVDISFSTMPWPRALESTRNGAVSGAFAASYSAERATFAAFPMRDGQPDPAKAMREQVYYLYAAPDAPVALKDGRLEAPLARIVVERGSIGVSLARSLGAEPVEVANYSTMVRMIAERREVAVLGVDHHVRAAIRREPLLAQRVRHVFPAVGRMSSYVMFGRRFHEEHPTFVECFWNNIAAIRATTQYQELVRSYNDGDFIE